LQDCSEFEPAVDPGSVPGVAVLQDRAIRLAAQDLAVMLGGELIIEGDVIIRRSADGEPPG
jgi:hypothetical protein